MNSLVSIIIPTYNRAHLIGETLDSVLAQTYKSWECIVVDDGSTDYTDELLEFYTKKDSRIQYHHRPTNRKKGANACRNYGFEMSRGEYIQWLDSDDLLGTDKIKKQIKTIRKSQEALVFCSWITYNNFLEKKIQIFEPQKKVFSNLIFFENLHLFGGFLPLHSYLTSRSLIHKSGLWNEYLLINQDGEFFNRLILNIDRINFSAGFVIYRMNKDDLKTSNYNSLAKVEDLVRSWKLIEGYHKIKFKNEKEGNYLRFAKEYLFNVLKPSYSVLIKQNSDFFAHQIKEHRKKNTFSKKVKRRLKTLMRKL